MYRLYAAISIIIGMYLDSVLFAKVNIAGVVPDCVLVVIVCMGIQLGATEAAAVGCAAGLVIDILFGKAVGINAIAYMVAGSVGGIFYKKYFAGQYDYPGADGWRMRFLEGKPHGNTHQDGGRKVFVFRYADNLYGALGAYERGAVHTGRTRCSSPG